MKNDDAAAGWPCASLVEIACDTDGSPILLISQLAVHTRNLGRDLRISLLFDGTKGNPSPLTGSRVTVFGRAEQTAQHRHRARYLARHPAAAEYADFADFGFWHVTPTGAHIVAGFGKIGWIAAENFMLDSDAAQRFAEFESSIVEHMNADHSDTIGLLAKNFLERPGAGWEASGCDPEGLDLRLGQEFARLEFDEATFEPESIRKFLVALTRRARSKG